MASTNKSLERDQAYFDRRWAAMSNERSTFQGHWKEIAEFTQPRKGRFFISDRNKGTKRHQAIINSAATQALRTATSGMLAGTMSPTRPWFGLETHDPKLMERQEVKTWLFEVENIMRTVMNDSNFYGQASTMLTELLAFGTAAMSHEDDFEDVARFYTHTVGSYVIGQNDRYEVDTFGREFEWTTEQIVAGFDYENCSKAVQDEYDRGNYMGWHAIRHIIEPNPMYEEGSELNTKMKFTSVYYEPTATNGALRNRFLRKSGFKEFPVFVPRWSVTGEDIYATDCPGMTSLGDVKGLQIQEKRKAQGIDKMINPPLSGPASVRNANVNALPGGLTIYDQGIGDQRLAPLYMVNPQLQEMRVDIEAIEMRIEKAYFNDLFLAISNMEGIQPRNQLDIIQRNEERLLQLGPVLEQLQGEFLDPLIDRVFNQASRADILPPPPDGVEGTSLRIKYISTLAMAQRAVATQNIDRMVQFAGGLMQMGFPDAGMKVDALQAVDEYAKAIGAPPTVIVPDEVVQQKLAAQQQQQQQAQQLEAAQQGANVAKMASEAKLSEDESLLTEAVGGDE